ncbi:MAG: TIGR03086 family protein [Acidimicrobiia bacterium]|nr:TIGR03086 family protein [Acidimicrobiia bacterium]
MSDNLRNYTKAIYTMDAAVNRVAPDRWDAPSPCDQWTAKEVVGHCLYALHSVAAYTGAREKPAEMPEAERAGTDPAAVWSAARDEVLAALDQDGALDTEVDGPFGRAPIDNALPVMTMDLTTHTWDLAKATGQDPVIPRELAIAAYEGIKGFGDGARRPGLFADEVRVADDADIVTKMAAMAGRKV